MPVLRRTRSPTPIADHPASPRLGSESPGSPSWTYEYDVFPNDSDETSLDGPLILAPPPIYKRAWLTGPKPTSEDDKRRSVPSNPKFIIPVRMVMKKMKTLIGATDLNENYKGQLQQLIRMRVAQRIREVLRVQNITSYMRYKGILEIYWRYFPQYTNLNLVEETVAYIKEKADTAEIRSVDRDEPSSSTRADNELDVRFVEECTQQEISSIFKDMPGTSLSHTGEGTSHLPEKDIVKDEKPLLPTGAENNIDTPDSSEAATTAVEAMEADAHMQEMPVVSGNDIKDLSQPLELESAESESELSDLDSDIGGSGAEL